MFGMAPLLRQPFAPAMAVVWLLAGCGLFQPREMVGPVDEMMFASQPDTCGLAAVNSLAGQDFTVLADHALVGPLRVIWPGQEITSDLVPNRLNAQVSDQGRIARLFCG